MLNRSEYRERLSRRGQNGARIRWDNYHAVRLRLKGANMTKREQCVDWLKEHGLMPEGTTITCDDCPISDDCKWAYDPYNTNGDCLGDK